MSSTLQKRTHPAKGKSKMQQEEEIEEEMQNSNLQEENENEDEDQGEDQEEQNEEDEEETYSELVAQSDAKEEEDPDLNEEEEEEAEAEAEILPDGSYRQPTDSTRESDFDLVLSVFRTALLSKKKIFDALRSQIGQWHNSESSENATELIKTKLPEFVNGVERHLNAVWSKLLRERKFDIEVMPTTAEEKKST